MPKKKYPKITKKDLKEGVKKWKEENELDRIAELFAYVVVVFMRSASKGNLNKTELYEVMDKIKNDFKKELKNLPKENKWEEEFEDEIHFVGEVETNEDDIESLELERNNFPELIRKYIGIERTKLKIKARKGEIVIKRIK